MDTSSLAALIQGCETEKLHLSGAIQGFGAMLRLSGEAPFQITHASANLADYLGMPPASLLGQNIDAIGCLNAAMLARLGEQPGESLPLPRLIQGEKNQVDALLMRSPDGILVEFEASAVGAAPLPIQELQRPFLRPPFGDEEIAAYHDSLVKAIALITGFDRIMLYRFHEDWSGEVTAEATSNDSGRYLGLRFPASDIPAIARNLYLLNPYRLIPDIHANPVDILGLAAQPPDLTWSNLRSVSPVHLQYLAHMGVSASFSVPIVITGRLWGLVACHHRLPQGLSPDQRQASVTLTRAYSLGLVSHLASRRLQMIDSMDRRVEKLLERIAQHADPLDGIEHAAPALMEIVSARGFAMVINDDVVMTADTPEMDCMSRIDQWFLTRREPVLAIDSMEGLLAAATDDPSFQYSGGMLAVKARSPRAGWVRFYWFRPAEPQEVAWAGNPNKPTVEHAGALMLSPRRSFEKWVEIKTHQCRPWSNEENLTASKFRSTLLHWL